MHDIEAAFAEFRRLGAYERDWTAWGNLFTDDALYVDHASQTRRRGGREIAAHVHSAMAAVAPMTFSIDWWIVDGDWVAMYIWNHLPDPAGGGERFGFPNITVLHFDGDGRCDVEEDFYNPADAAAVVTRWYGAGGLAEHEPDRSLTGHEGHATDLSQIVVSRSELEVEFARFCARTRQAVASGDWVSWAQQFTSRASIHDHGLGRFAGRTAIGEAASRMAPAIVRSPTVRVALYHGNRIVAVTTNESFEGATFEMGEILHYAGDGRWSYAEWGYRPPESTDRSDVM